VCPIYALPIFVTRGQVTVCSLPAAGTLARVIAASGSAGAAVLARIAVAARGVVAGLVVLPPRLARAGVAAAVWSALVGVRPTRIAVAARGVVAGLVVLPPRLARAGVAAAVWSALVGVRPTRIAVAASGAACEGRTLIIDASVVLTHVILCPAGCVSWVAVERTMLVVYTGSTMWMPVWDAPNTAIEMTSAPHRQGTAG
jgi:hypothetical protein